MLIGILLMPLLNSLLQLLHRNDLWSIAALSQKFVERGEHLWWFRRGIATPQCLHRCRLPSSHRPALIECFLDAFYPEHVAWLGFQHVHSCIVLTDRQQPARRREQSIGVLLDHQSACICLLELFAKRWLIHLSQYSFKQPLCTLVVFLIEQSLSLQEISLHQFLVHTLRRSRLGIIHQLHNLGRRETLSLAFLQNLYRFQIEFVIQRLPGFRQVLAKLLFPRLFLQALHQRRLKGTQALVTGYLCQSLPNLNNSLFRSELAAQVECFFHNLLPVQFAK